MYNDFILTELKYIISVTSVTILQTAKNSCELSVGQTDIPVPGQVGMLKQTEQCFESTTEGISRL